MNDRPIKPAEAGQDNANLPVPTTAPTESPQETGRELVPFEAEEKRESWVYRFLTKLGLRSSGTLRDDLNEALAGEGEAGDLFSPEERAMLQNILRLRERRVEDVMVPRAEVRAVDEHIALGELLQIFEDNGHSRMPVYSDNLDDPRGMVLVKDVLLHLVAKSTVKSRSKKAGNGHAKLNFGKVDLDKPLSSIKAVRSVLFVPPSMLAADLMARMQATRTQMALVIDEYGGTDGLVTLEDIVEEVVGDIEDEHDEDDELITVDGNLRWTVDARTELEDIQEVIGEAFDPGSKGDDMDTIGGLVFALAGHIPVRGEVVRGMPGFEFRILDADPRRVRRLQIVQISRHPVRRKTPEEEKSDEAKE
ncbi:hemolysin family protein [Pseudahrensia aquimaris]|uniref:Hemolysin family protein n=1 Tax=Pseudahrensia aquimaris TaxID=744461 RepID=A0ABW3FGD8_9HYPH